GAPEDAPYPPADPAAVSRGLAAHPYREADPEIVDRSLLRWGYRLRREGEEDPPPVYGRRAPKLTLVISSVKRTRITTALG
ncbi:MAG: hypothetical protein WKF67_13055, partial [Rubrobacteraceae bacterium]